MDRDYLHISHRRVWFGIRDSQASLTSPSYYGLSLHRAYVVEHLQALVDKFTLRLATQLRVSHEPCRILPFGSYAIGAHLRTSDMDLVCIAPHYVDHLHFFQQFPQVLRNGSIQVLEVDIYGCMTRVV